MENPILQSTRYLVNPDVVLREEDEDGALLFNPDTNQVKILNATALIVWKQFTSPNPLEAAIQAINENFDQVPGDEVETDIREFIESMAVTGFIGTVDES